MMRMDYIGGWGLFVLRLMGLGSLKMDGGSWSL